MFLWSVILLLANAREHWVLLWKIEKDWVLGCFRLSMGRACPCPSCDFLCFQISEAFWRARGKHARARHWAWFLGPFNDRPPLSKFWVFLLREAGIGSTGDAWPCFLIQFALFCVCAKHGHAFGLLKHDYSASPLFPSKASHCHSFLFTIHSCFMSSLDFFDFLESFATYFPFPHWSSPRSLLLYLNSGKPQGLVFMIYVVKIMLHALWIALCPLFYWVQIFTIIQWHFVSMLGL